MRVIVVTGGGRRVGKTELAVALGALLPEARVVKLGEHARREGKNDLFFALDTKFRDVAQAVGRCRFLIIESGRILDDPDCRPDLTVFLPHPESDKPGAQRRRERADLIRGESMSDALLADLQARLGIDQKLLSRIYELINRHPSR